MASHHPIGFSDEKDIIISKNDIFYHCSGSSYLEKFKNGLSLGDVLCAELHVEQFTHLYLQSISSPPSIPILDELKDSSQVDLDSYVSDEDWGEYDEKYYSSKKKMKKDGRKKSKRSKYNRSKLDKKWKRKLGHDDKWWKISQETPLLIGTCCGGCLDCEYCDYMWNGLDEYDGQNKYCDLAPLRDFIKTHKHNYDKIHNYLLQHHPGDKYIIYTYDYDEIDTYWNCAISIYRYYLSK